MYRTIKVAYFTIALCLFFTYSQAQERVPANPNPITIKQKDGTQLTFYMKGDENRHWRETEDGYTILENKKGIYEYAKADKKGKLKCSGIKAHEIDKRTKKEMRFLSKIKKSLTNN